jgi:hypothetical protein
MSVRKIQYKLKEYRTEAAATATVERRPALGRQPAPASRTARVAGVSPSRRG